MMPLMRDQSLGYDATKMVFRFTMLNKGETVKCEISSAALDELAGGKGTANAAREDLFLRNVPRSSGSLLLFSMTARPHRGPLFASSRNIFGADLGASSGR